MSREIKALFLGYALDAPLCVALCLLPKDALNAVNGCVAGVALGMGMYFLAYWLLGKPWLSPRP